MFSADLLMEEDRYCDLVTGWVDLSGRICYGPSFARKDDKNIQRDVFLNTHRPRT